jgi:virulence factor
MREQCLAKGPMTHALCEFYKFRLWLELRAYDHMLGDCTHAIDAVRWTCGGEFIGIEGQCKRIGVPDINWIGATLQFDNGATGYVINSWCSRGRVFRVQMHAPGIAVDVEVEGEARVYADGDYHGVAYDAKQVAGSDQTFIYGAFQAKNRDFIDSLKTGQDVTSSPSRDCVKTMQVAEQLLAMALLKGA